MEWYYSLSLMVGLVCVLMLLGLPIAFTFFLANIVGAFLFLGGGVGIVAFITGSMSAIANFSLAPIPFFLLMGEILLRTGIAYRAIDAIDQAVRRVPGRLSVVAVTGGTVFSALSGSTIATTAMLGQALVPDMMRRGYHPTMAVGPIIAIGGVDMLIPPSNLAVIFATIASSLSIVKVSVAEFLISGTLPGLIMSVCFIAYIIVRCWLNPKLAPPGEPSSIAHGSRWKPLLLHIAPLLFIFTVIMGSMYFGFASPSRVRRGRLPRDCDPCSGISRSDIFNPARCSPRHGRGDHNAVHDHRGVNDFRPDPGDLGSDRWRSQCVAGVSFWPPGHSVRMVGILIVLGCFMEQIAMMLLTLPFFIPLANSLQSRHVVAEHNAADCAPDRPHASAVWIPAVRHARALHRLEITLKDIWLSTIPFVIIVLGVLLLTIYVPWIATGLTRW